MSVKSSAVAGVVLIAIAIALLAALPPQTMRPLVAGDLSYDFGTIEIPPGRLESRTHQFALRNVSGETLNIDRITTTCGCAGAQSSKPVIPAGEPFEIDATLVVDSTGMRSETVTVHLADRDPVLLSIKGAGRLLQDLSSMPNVVAFDSEEPTSSTCTTPITLLTRPHLPPPSQFPRASKLAANPGSGCCTLTPTRISPRAGMRK